MLRRGEQKVVDNINIIRTVEELQALLGKEFSRMKVQSMICHLARRNYIGLGRAKALLKDAPCTKFLTVPVIKSKGINV